MIERPVLWTLYEREIFAQESGVLPQFWAAKSTTFMVFIADKKDFQKKKILRTNTEKTYSDTYKHNYIHFGHYPRDWHVVAA